MEKKKEQDSKEEGEGMGRTDMMFMMAVVILLSISGPYMYYALLTYNYIHEHSATLAGPNFIPPSLSDGWITAISAVSIYIVKLLILNGCHPLVRAVLRPNP